MSRPRTPAVDRIRPRLAVDGECWLWTGSKNKSGYGRVHSEGATRLVHRVMYEALVGPIPPTLVIDHLCRRRDCANPAHMEPVTNGENVLRGESRSASNARRTHCRLGHPLAGDNLYLDNRGKRNCLSCTRAAWRRSEERKKARRRLGHGDDLTEFSAEVADRLASEWEANQPPPADPEGET